MNAPFLAVRGAYIVRARMESGRIADARQWMLDNGFELLDVPGDALLTADGREVLRAHGRAWALRPEIHAQRLAEAMEQAKQRDAASAEQSQQQTDTTCTTLIDGQLCGGTLGDVGFHVALAVADQPLADADALDGERAQRLSGDAEPRGDDIRGQELCRHAAPRSFLVCQ